jgi:glycosyltransferase involved in cell wall biosynthesis
MTPTDSRSADSRKYQTVRILLATSMVPDAGGIGAMPKLFHAQLTGLLERNDVTLVCSFGEDPGQAEAAEALLAAGVDAHFVDRRRSGSLPRRWRVRAELGAAWALGRRPWRVVCGSAGLQPMIDSLATEDFDVIAVEDNPLAVLRFPPGTPAVLTEHEAVRAPAGEFRASRLRERPMRALRAADWRRWGAFLPSAWAKFDLLQVYCSGDAEAVRRQAPGLAGRVRVNPYGIELPAACDPAAEQPGTILFTGTFAHLPNRDAARWLATEIMPAVRARHPEARLRLVGSAPPHEVLDLAGPGIEVIADAPSIAPHLEAAALVIAPVRSGGGMRMKVLEAMAAGKAVVTTPLGAEGFDVLDPPPPLAIAEGAGEIAGATAALLGDAGMRRDLGRRARDFAARLHTPRAWAARLEAVYEEARASIPAD